MTRVVVISSAWRNGDVYPFFNEEFTFHQPDGTLLRVRGTGDENSAIFETLDGFTVMLNPVSGFYEYAIQSEGREEIVPSGVQVNAVPPSALNLEKAIRSSHESLQTLALAPSKLPRTDPRKSRSTT